MDFSIQDYLQGKAPQGLSAENANNNFTYLLAFDQALMEVLNLTDEQQEKVASLADAYYQEALSKMNEVRKGG